MHTPSGARAEIEPAGCGRLVSGIRWLLFDLKVDANSGLGAEKKQGIRLQVQLPCSPPSWAFSLLLRVGVCIPLSECFSVAADPAAQVI